MATINVNEATKSELKTYCSKQEITQGDFVKSALAYFKKSGINPSDPPESVKEEIAKVDKRMSQLIAFQKTFEKTQMLPLVEAMLKIEGEIRERFEGIPEGLEQHGKILEVMSKQLAMLGGSGTASQIPKPQAPQQGQSIDTLKLQYKTIWEYFSTVLSKVKTGSMSSKLYIDLSTQEISSYKDYLDRFKPW